MDFSESSKAAVKEAGHIAALRKSWLNIVHVIDREFIEREVDEKFLAMEDFKKKAEEALSKFALEALESPHPSVRFFVFDGHPFEELLNQAAGLKCDLMAMGSYGNRGTSDHVGTTAARFVREAPLPVLLVRVKQSIPYNDIVACHDFSETSRKLEEVAATVRKTWPDLVIKAAAVPGNNADSEICDYIQQVNAGLAVLGTRGRTGFKKLLLGTTAEHVIHKCRCSVLAVKLGNPN